MYQSYESFYKDFQNKNFEKIKKKYEKNNSIIKTFYKPLTFVIFQFLKSAAALYALTYSLEKLNIKPKTQKEEYFIHAFKNIYLKLNDILILSIDMYHKI